MVSGLKGTTYEEMLRKLKMMSLKIKKDQVDHIVTKIQRHKCIHGSNHNDYTKWFDLAKVVDMTTRSYACPLSIIPKKKVFRLDDTRKS